MRTLARFGVPLFALGASIALGCGKPEQPIESGRGFMTVVYNDTTVEQFSRTTKRLMVTIVERSDTLRYTAMLGDSGLVTSVGLSVVAHRGHDRETMAHKFRMPKGTMPIMAGSGVMFEQILRRVRALGGDSVSVPVMLVGASSELNVFTVSGNGPDSLIAAPQNGQAQGNEFHIAIDSAWRITGAILPLGPTVMKAM